MNWLDFNSIYWTITPGLDSKEVYAIDFPAYLSYATGHDPTGPNFSLLIYALPSLYLNSKVVLTGTDENTEEGIFRISLK